MTVAVYQGASLGSLTPIVSDAGSAAPNDDPTVKFDPVPYEVYHVVVSTLQAGDVG